MTYVQRKFYFPEELYMALSLQAKQEGLRIVDKLRRYTERGLREDKNTEKSGAEALLELAKIGEKARWRGPRDLSTNHDRYFVEAYKELKEGKKRNRR